MRTALNRSLSLSQITLYGVGTILGAGIYVLLGEVALASGHHTPLAFLVAAIVVSFSANSYRHLSRQFPVSAGEAVYILEAFASINLSRAAGLTIVFAGIVSAATLASGFTGYFAILAALPDWLTVVVLVTVLAGLAAWGVKQSVGVAIATTLVELVGITLVIWASLDALPVILENPQQYFVPDSLPAWSGIAAGSFIAFYAFIGFEDMVNMAEEVKDPERNMFKGILLALIITSSIYIVVAVCAVAAVPLDELAGARAPLALIVERNTTFPVAIMAAISLVAVVNGALLQIIMCARVLYGMGKKHLVPSRLASVNPRTQTPIAATLLVAGLVVCFALALPLATLAKTTSTLILCVFTLVNLSLVTLNWRRGKRGFGALALPSCGAIMCALFIALQLWV